MLERGVALGGRYVLAELIARGGMGEVWRAEDTVLGRRVAVKALLPVLAGDPGFAARFRTEARAMASLSHPGIVEIYDYGQVDGIAYLVMQLVDSESLGAVIRAAGRLEPGRAMLLLSQAADAIHAAHTQGIVHRDVKPGNLLLRPDGRLALTDFGIARIVAADRLTSPGEVFGTASYLAPEQVTGGPVGPPTDVYALGVVAYEMLTGRKPFEGESPLAVALRHVHDEPPALPDTVPEPVRALVARALAKHPADRWPSAAALAQAALAAQAASVAHGAPAAIREPAQPHPSSPAAATGARPVGGPAPGRGRRRLVVGIVAALAVAAIVGYLLRPEGNAGRPSPDSGTKQSPVVAVTPTPISHSPAATSSPATTSTDRPASGAATRGATAPTGAAPPTAAGAAGPTSAAATTRTVPAMYGWRESEVRAEMDRLGLVTHVTYRATPDKCYAIEQSPTGGTVVAAGATIDVVIATATGICKQV